MNRTELLEKYKDGIKVGPSGFVRLVDVMGDDSSIVQAARVSYGAGTKTVSEDEGLIRYLVRHRHTTPLEMCEIKFHIKIEMDTWRQMVRTRTANINEYSTRYSEALEDMFVTEPSKWRLQATDNKQGSGAYIEAEEGLALSELELHALNTCRSVYDDLLEAGVAREQARKVLPLSQYTELYWKIDLHNLMHFLSLRLDAHAQLEIREFAQAMAQIVADWCPLAWQAFLDYRMNAVTFSAQEMEIIKKLLDDADVSGYYNAAPELRAELLNILPTKRERIEFWKKIN